MEGVLSMAFYEAGLAPPMWPITIQATKLSFKVATSNTCKVGWGGY
jgi:hypothetical protein